MTDLNKYIKKNKLSIKRDGKETTTKKLSTDGIERLLEGVKFENVKAKESIERASTKFTYSIVDAKDKVIAKGDSTKEALEKLKVKIEKEELKASKEKEEKEKAKVKKATIIKK